MTATDHAATSSHLCALMDRARRLARTVREHGHPCRVMPDGSLRAAVRIHLVASGRNTWQVETLPATRSAVAEWLGY